MMVKIVLAQVKQDEVEEFCTGAEFCIAEEFGAAEESTYALRGGPKHNTVVSPPQKQRREKAIATVLLTTCEPPEAQREAQEKEILQKARKKLAARALLSEAYQAVAVGGGVGGAPADKLKKFVNNGEVDLLEPAEELDARFLIIFAALEQAASGDAIGDRAAGDVIREAFLLSEKSRSKFWQGLYEKTWDEMRQKLLQYVLEKLLGRVVWAAWLPEPSLETSGENFEREAAEFRRHAEGLQPACSLVLELMERLGRSYDLAPADILCQRITLGRGWAPHLPEGFRYVFLGVVVWGWGLYLYDYVNDVDSAVAGVLGMKDDVWGLLLCIIRMSSYSSERDRVVSVVEGEGNHLRAIMN